MQDHWMKLKSTDYERFRTELYSKIQTSLEKDSIRNINRQGIYHNVKNRQFWEQMKVEYNSPLPNIQHWLGKGNTFGIWCSLFSPHTTYTFTTLSEIPIIRFKLYPISFIYDPCNPLCVKAWNLFITTHHFQKPNEFDELKNDQQRSLADRLKDANLPFHALFYSVMKCVGVIGHSDYCALVILNTDLIQSAEFQHYSLEKKRICNFHNTQ